MISSTRTSIYVYFDRVLCLTRLGFKKKKKEKLSKRLCDARQRWKCGNISLGAENINKNNYSTDADEINYF